MREKSKLRESDEKTANQVADFLDSTFYKDEASNVERVDDVQRQVKGVDIIFDYNGKTYYCDEKSTAQWRNIRTFTLELSFIDKQGHVKEGWLTSEKEINNSFMLVWLDNDGVDIALVEKDKILKYLEDKGWTIPNLRYKSNQIREYYPDVEMGDIYKNGCRFTFSTQLVEKPINVQLSRGNFKKMAVFTKKYPTTMFYKEKTAG